MENSIEKLTAIQKEVGYEKGDINNVAVLGLFGEAGEVINECDFLISTDGIDGLQLIQDGIASSLKVDSLKKQIRDKIKKPYKIHIKNEEDFDNEMADVLYYLNALAINRGKTLNDYAELSCKKVMKYKTQKDIRHANVSHATKSEE